MSKSPPSMEVTCDECGATIDVVLIGLAGQSSWTEEGVLEAEGWVVDEYDDDLHCCPDCNAKHEGV
jgi:hypothetical protein